MANSEVLTAKEVAKLLRISVKTVYVAVKLGQIPAFTVGRSIRFAKSAIDRLILQRTGEGAVQ